MLVQPAQGCTSVGRCAVDHGAFIENDCELVVIATPVAAVDDYLARLRDWGYTGVVTDTISTKGHILAAATELLPAPARTGLCERNDAVCRGHAL